MRRRFTRKSWIQVLLLAAVTLQWAGAAAAPPLVTLRFASIDAVMRDTETVAEAAGQPFDGPALLAQALAAAGISDPSALDRQRPVLAYLPVEGMLLQQRGIVVAVPVSSTAAALDAMAATYPSRGMDGALHVFSDPSGAALFAAEKDSYLVVGQTRDFVGRFDGSVITQAWDGPAGNAQLEVFLEPLLPLLQAGLVSVREHLRNEIREQLDQPRAAPLGQPTPDGGAVAELVDLYLDTVQGILLDLSRVQTTLEVAGDHAFYHQRVVPKPGTATAEFLAAQNGELTALGRSVRPGALSMAGHVTITPRLEAGLKVFTTRYVRLMGQLLQNMQQTGEQEGGGRAELGPFAAYLANAEQLLAESMRCLTGDFAAGVDLSAKSGMGISQAVGYRDTEDCREIAERSVQQMASLTAGAGGEPANPVETTEVAGTPVRRFTVDMKPYVQAADPEERRVLEQLYGGTRVENYVALADGVMYSATGYSARERLASMLEAKGRSGAPADGIGPATFAPLSPGPGMYLGVSLPKVLAFARDLTGAEDPQREELEALARFFSDQVSRAAMALRFDPGGATFDLTVPLKVLGAKQPAPLSPPAEESKGT